MRAAVFACLRRALPARVAQTARVKSGWSGVIDAPIGASGSRAVQVGRDPAIGVFFPNQAPQCELPFRPEWGRLDLNICGRAPHVHGSGPGRWGVVTESAGMHGAGWISLAPTRAVRCQISNQKSAVERPTGWAAQKWGIQTADSAGKTPHSEGPPTLGCPTAVRTPSPPDSPPSPAAVSVRERTSPALRTPSPPDSPPSPAAVSVRERTPPAVRTPSPPDSPPSPAAVSVRERTRHYLTRCP